MKEKYAKLLLMILFSVFVQACSTNPPKVVNYPSVDSLPTVSDMQLLANNLGKTAVTEVYINNPMSAMKKTEYRVTEDYTAASGRQCKETIATNASGDVVQEAAVVCQSKLGDWYWPRKIILQ